MGYSVHLYRRETQARHRSSPTPAFFEDEQNLAPFSKAELKRLTGRLELLGFEEGKAKNALGRVFFNDALNAEALLTPGGLYLTASGENGIFEIMMMASEEADKDVAKYDPQMDEWE